MTPSGANSTIVIQRVQRRNAHPLQGIDYFPTVLLPAGGDKGINPTR